MFITPMKAKKDNHEELPGIDYLFEIKYDGIRVIMVWNSPTITIFSKSGRDITYKFPELTDPKRLNSVFLSTSGVFDAELVCFKDGIPHFPSIISRFHSKDTDKIYRGVQENPVTACLFDALRIGDSPIMHEGLLNRKELMNGVLLTDEVYTITKVHRFGQKLYDREKERNAEGIIAKRVGSIYRPGSRTQDWLKVKIMYEEIVCVYGYTAGLGKREGFFGALMFCDDKGVPLGNVGTGFTDAQLQSMMTFLQSRGPKMKSPGVFVLDKPFTILVKGMRKLESGAIREPVFIRTVGV